jgi:hypothetical protein
VIQTILTVTAERLAALDAGNAVSLIADLLWAEARRIGLPTTDVHISKRITVADGGVDASVIPPAPDSLEDSFMPLGRSGFQIKTGDSFKPWQRSQIKEELFGDKPPSREALGAEVRACLDDDGTYVLVCTGTDPVGKEESEAFGHLREFFSDCGYTNAKVKVWGQTTIVGLLKAFPSLALGVNGLGGANFATHAGWSNQSEMNRSFKTGEKQQSVIQVLQDELRSNGKPVHVRVRGEAGIGKTRLVLEATVADDIKPLVIYTDKPSQLLSGPLMAELVREDSQVNAILVVDECDADNRALIWNKLEHHSPRLKLISIFNDLDEPSGRTVVTDAPPLSDEQIVEIIQGYGIPENEARNRARDCDGSPRVAHVIGLNLRNNPEDVLRSPDTVNVWDRYIVGGNDPKSEDVHQRLVVLRHIALFKRFGFGPLVITEAKAIAGLVEEANPDITWARFREIVKLLRDRKILQGENTLYITPRLLHIKLWSDWWNTYGQCFDPKTISELPGKLPEWCREMFQYAAESQPALEVTRELLNEKGRFGKIDFFENRRSANFFLALTNAAPEAALRYLERTVGTWDVERLTKFKDGRREAVWALERIAIWKKLFSGAARLLLKLAEAENENFSNNSTGVFADLFSPGIGGVAPTEGSPLERFPILKEALESRSKKQREVALKACEKALQTSHFYRMVGAEYQGLRRPPQLWMPMTWDEVHDSYRRAWLLLMDKLNALEPDERYRAIEILATHARGLTLIRSLSDLVIDSLSHLADVYPEARRKIIEEIEIIIHYDGKAHSPENLTKLEALRAKLTDTDFHSQMERYVGMDLLQDGFDVQGNTVDRVGPRISLLATQAVENPALLDAELSWLVTDAAKNGYRFGRELATLDQEFMLLEKLIVAQRNPTTNGSAFFLGGYFSVLFERNNGLWETTLDRLVEDKSLRPYVSELTWRSGMTERAAIRILYMAENNFIPLGSLRMFSFGGVVRKVPEHVFAGWVNRFMRENTRVAAWTALDLFHFYYLMGGSERFLPRKLTLQLLTAEPFFKKHDTSIQMEDYDWTQVAKAFLVEYPGDGVEIAKCLLRSFGEDGTITGRFHSEAAGVLTIIAKQNPADIWRIISGYIGPPVDSRAFHIVQWLRDGGLGLMPSDSVWAWIDADIPVRAPYLARYIPPVLSHLSSPVCWTREMLVRYGDREDVRSHLFSNFMTESWSGPQSDHYLAKKQWLEEFRTHETEPNVIRWLDDFIDLLNRTIENARVREERELY